MVPLRHIARTSFRTLGFSKQRLTISPMLGLIHELQRLTRVLQNLRSILCGISESMWKGLLTSKCGPQRAVASILADQGAANRSKLLVRSRYQITIIFCKLGVNSERAAMKVLVQKRRHTSQSTFKLQAAWTADA